MTECSAQTTLGFHPQSPIQVSFDAPEVTSDAGGLLLRQLDELLGLSAGFSSCLPDERDPSRVVHDRREQTRQRLYQIALGYEDCNDADTLRHDPLLKTVCDRTPNDPVGLSSQPTLCRFENAPDGLTLRRLMRWLEQSYVEALPESTEVLVLDIDATDDETHGQQELSFFHGFYDHHMYHPLMVFDGDSGQLISAVLRPGNCHASRGALPLLRRIIRRLRQRFPHVGIVVRGDAGFAMPKLMRELEKLSVDYVFGIAKNERLKRFAEPTMRRAKGLFEQTERTVKCYTSFEYAAASWPHPRHIVAKAEHSWLGANPRFVVTSSRASIRRQSTAPTSSGEPASCGSKTSSVPWLPIGSPARASPPTASASCSTPPPIGSFTHCVRRPRRSRTSSAGPNSTPCASVCSRSPLSSDRACDGSGSSCRVPTPGARPSNGSPSEPTLHPYRPEPPLSHNLLDCRTPQGQAVPRSPPQRSFPSPYGRNYLRLADLHPSNQPVILPCTI